MTFAYLRVLLWMLLPTGSEESTQTADISYGSINVNVRQKRPGLSWVSYEGFCGKWSGAWDRVYFSASLWFEMEHSYRSRSPYIVLLCSPPCSPLLVCCDFNSMHPGSLCLCMQEAMAACFLILESPRSLTHCWGVASFSQMFPRATDFLQLLRFGTFCKHRIT